LFRKKGRSSNTFDGTPTCICICSLSLFPKTVNICGIAAGLLTRLRFDAFPVAQWLFVVLYGGLQQRVLFLIFTGFPFHPAQSGNRNTDANINRIAAALFISENLIKLISPCI